METSARLERGNLLPAATLAAIDSLDTGQRGGPEDITLETWDDPSQTTETTRQRQHPPRCRRQPG